MEEPQSAMVRSDKARSLKEVAAPPRDG